MTNITRTPHTGAASTPRVVIHPCDESASSYPPGKVADAEVHFDGGTLDGTKLIGFAIWQRRTSPGQFNVTHPARQYSVNGERRSFALLRPATSTNDVLTPLRDLIVDAYLSTIAHAKADAVAAGFRAVEAADRAAQATR